MNASVEELVHGGFLAKARDEIEQRLKGEPVLYDRLLASIYYRLSGDQAKALQVLDADVPKDCFEVVHNRILCHLHDLNFQAALECAQTSLKTSEDLANWTVDQTNYLLDVVKTTTPILLTDSQFGRSSGIARNGAWQSCGFSNLDSSAWEICPGWIDRRSRLARVVSAQFDPQSLCWLEEDRRSLVPELLQPTHDFRGFVGGMRPDIFLDNSRFSTPDLAHECLHSPSVYLDYNPHFGHFLTHSASFASAIPYAEAMVTQSYPHVTVLSRTPVDQWAQDLLQNACRAPLTFQQIDSTCALRVSALVVCPQTWIEWHYCHVDHRRIFQRAASEFRKQNVAAQNPVRSYASRWLYLSRSRVTAGLRHSVNEIELEQKLAKVGFKVLHPQEMPLSELCAELDQASLIAGSNGSAMHNILFRLESEPLATLNFAHFLPSVNCSLLEKSCDIRQNFYSRCSHQYEDGGSFCLEFDIPRCLDAVDSAVAAIGR